MSSGFTEELTLEQIQALNLNPPIVGAQISGYTKE